MININGKLPRLIKINGTVPDIVKINNSIVWKNAFSINFKANFHWDQNQYSSGCWDYYNECIYLSDFTILANHYFEHLYLDSVKIYTTDNSETYEDTFLFGNELKSGYTCNIEKKFYCGETDSNRFIRVDFYFRAWGKFQIQKKVSVSANTNDLSRNSDPVLSATYSDTISAFTQQEIDWIKKTS
ncbi:hypothetical protein [Treponema berlinense]|uniref:hypothetical protein n=1 Tax=Treponema berlinense TaxID=225004 RepID=UPI003FD8C7E8